MTSMIAPLNSPVTLQPSNNPSHLPLGDIDWSNFTSDLAPGLTTGTSPLDFLSMQMPDWLVNVELPATTAYIQPLNSQAYTETTLKGTVTDVTSRTPYERQMEILQRPDELAMYFPTEEQRQIFHHFVNETAPDLLVIPAVGANNPWLAYLSPLAIGQPSGQDVSHDAFRASLLSLASFDIGMKMNAALKHSQNNAMYKLSETQRGLAMQLLDLGANMNAGKNDLGAADLIVAAALVLAIRDRLAGSQDWEGPLNHGVQAIAAQDGPAAYLGKNPQVERRFLLEQMACVELLDGLQDHLALVYGWDRPALQLCARAMIIWDEARQLDNLERDNAKFSHSAVDNYIRMRKSALSLQSVQLLDQIKLVRNRPWPLTRSTRAMRGITSLLLALEIALMADPLGLEVDLNDEKVQSKVRVVLNTVEEAISQGSYSGFLLPLIWMAVCAVSENKQRVERLFARLQPHYRIDADLMKRLAKFDWSAYALEDIDKWEEIMKITKTYVPIF
ncbi:hypothetical protein V866_007744 [Kwoniella sp. B9012]